MQTSSELYPNLYMMIVGHPGVGKTRTLRVCRRLAMTLNDFHLAPISMTFAALVDKLDRSKRVWVVPGEGNIEFNSLYILAEEMGAFIHKYDNEMIKGLTHFYDPDPYEHERRGEQLRITIPSPQVSLICGVTPQDLMNFMPEIAWGQGLTSRMILIFSDERIVGDDFAPKTESKLEDLEHDLKIINNLYGSFNVTTEYADCIRNWRALGEPPVPDHPKLTHYITRRRVHLYKLSMVASIDRGNTLSLTRDDFNTALNWLVEAETFMPEIFKAGTTNVDGQAMDEIQHYVTAADTGHGVSEQRIVHFARERVPIHSILRVIEIMERSGQLHLVGTERGTGIKYYSTRVRETLQ